MIDHLVEQLQHVAIDWQGTSESPYMFLAIVQETVVRLRLNDFPDEPLCTLIVEGAEIDLIEFPECWTLPRHRREQR
jgi:hypothetical protein